MSILFLLNYRAPNIRTFSNLSLPSMEHVYLKKELTGKPEVSIENGIQEMEVMRNYENLRELYDIQQLIYRNTTYLYRLLYRILSLCEETFNPNSYHKSEGYDTGKISTSISDLLNASDFKENKTLPSHILHIDQSLIKFHSILLNIYDIKTSTACHNLRNYFSIPPPDESPKMDEYIRANHSERRISLLQTLTQKTAFKHLFLTSSIELETYMYRNKKLCREEKGIRVHFKEGDINIRKPIHISLETGNIGSLYYSLLSAILHDAIPHYTKPDDISKKYLACNTLWTIIVMELLLINWKNLLKCLKCFYNDSMRRHTFSQVFLEMSRKVSEDSLIANKAFNLHREFMAITKAIEAEKERYSRNFYRYMKYIQREPQHPFPSIIDKVLYF